MSRTAYTGSPILALSAEESAQVEGALQVGMLRRVNYPLIGNASTASPVFTDVFAVTFSSIGTDKPPNPKVQVKVTGTFRTPSGGAFREVSITSSFDRLQAGSPQEGARVNSGACNSTRLVTITNENEYTNVPPGDHFVTVRWKVDAGSVLCNALSEAATMSLVITVMEIKGT